MARTEADIARLEVHTSRAEVTDMRYRVGGLRHDLEFAEEQGNEARLEISELKTQIKTLEETISELRHQVKTRDCRIIRGMKYLSKSYEELDAGVYMHEIPIAPPSESSVHKRARIYEPLEGSSGGPTDSELNDESGGATSGDSAATPAAEPGRVA